jgi:hypothetical protein
VDSYPVGDLNDETLSQEIRLLGDIVVAASRVARHLTQGEIDQVLDLDQPTPAPQRAAANHASQPAGRRRPR